MVNERLYDCAKSEKSQIGVIIIMGRLKLLKNSVSFTYIGTYGTFSVTANCRVVLKPSIYHGNEELQFFQVSRL